MQSLVFPNLVGGSQASVQLGTQIYFSHINRVAAVPRHIFHVDDTQPRVLHGHLVTAVGEFRRTTHHAFDLKGLGLGAQGQ